MKVYTGITPMGHKGSNMSRFWDWTPITWMTLAVLVVFFITVFLINR